MKITTTVIDVAIKNTILKDFYHRCLWDALDKIDVDKKREFYNQLGCARWTSLGTLIEYNSRVSKDLLLTIARHSSTIKECIIYNIPYQNLYKRLPYHPGEICNTILSKFFSVNISWEEFYTNFHSYFSEKSFYYSIPNKVFNEYKEWAHTNSRVEIAKKIASKFGEKASLLIPNSNQEVPKKIITIF